MPAPLAVAAAKWAAKKVGTKAVNKAMSSEDKSSAMAVFAAMGIGALIIYMVVYSSLLGGLIALFGGAGGAAGLASMEACDTYALNETLPSEEAVKDIPPVAMTAYEDAGRTTGVDWPYIAAIGKIESDHGRNGGRHLNAEGNIRPTPLFGVPTDYGRAMGPMQFIPPTWDSQGQDGNADGTKDPQNIFDAALATGFYLKTSGAPADMEKAIFAYNHDAAYVAMVLAQAKKYTGSLGDVASPQIGGTLTIAHANIPVRSGIAGFKASMPKVLAKSPDFVSLNEMFDKSTAEAEAASPGYTAWRDTTPAVGVGSNQATDQMVMWKTADWSFVDGARIKIVEDDVTLYNGNPATWDRYATWVTLKRKSDGALASMISVHHMTNPGKFGPDRPARRAAYGEGMKILINQMSTLSAQGPVFVGGDFNVHATQSGAWTVTDKMSGAGFGWHDYNVDYVFYPKNSGVTMTQSWDGTMVSDHHWIAAKFNLGTKAVGGRGFSESDYTAEGLSDQLVAGTGHEQSPQTALAQTPAQTAVQAKVLAAIMGKNAPDSADDTDDTDDAAPGWVLPMKAGTFTYTATWGQAGSSWSNGYHTGLDFGADNGVPVYAAADGTITNDTSQAWAGPNLLTINHGTVDGESVVTWYAHLSQMAVTSGPVTAGQLIGYVGDLGNASGDHLHFEVHVGAGGYYDTDVDPFIWLASAGAPTGEGGAGDGCGPTGSSGVVGGDGAWGGYENGKIPMDQLCKVPFYNTYLECNANSALVQLNTAYVAKFGVHVGPVGGYRDYAGQVQCQIEKGSLCATPGTSNHGWGLAADLDGGGIASFGTPQHNWMLAHAPDYGWDLPEWARQGGSKPEPWHWEYVASGLGS